MATHFLVDLLRHFPAAQLAMIGPDQGKGSRQAMQQLAAACDWQRLMPQWEDLFCVVKAGLASDARAGCQESSIR